MFLLGLVCSVCGICVECSTWRRSSRSFCLCCIEFCNKQSVCVEPVTEKISLRSQAREEVKARQLAHKVALSMSFIAPFPT